MTETASAPVPDFDPKKHDRTRGPKNGNIATLTAKQAKALELALAGASYEQIAKACGYQHRSSAMRIVRDLIKKWAPIDPTDAEALRDTELARLDRLQAAHWTKALKGDYRSTEMILRIMRRRAQLVGLDAALKIDGGLSVELDEKITELVNRLNRGART
jgi:hypothetical protein